MLTACSTIFTRTTLLSSPSSLSSNAFSTLSQSFAPSSVTSSSRVSFSVSSSPSSSPSVTSLRKASLNELPVVRQLSTATSKQSARAPSPASRVQPKVINTEPPKASQSASHSEGVTSITWTDFFRFRRSRIMMERLCAFAGGVVSLFSGTYYFMAVADFDPTEPVFGVIDAFLAYGLASVGVGMLGAVVGLFSGGLIWRAIQKQGVINAIDQREKQFFKRLVAFRPAELRLSLQNPLPDYYGEGVTSVGEYRAWIKKQRDYRIKTEGFKAFRSIKRKSKNH
ncbi:TIM23 complex component [Blyttiomyces sp. JEL0837]|nr:TIM23 complex component [Blyttiomyces sp. JEL0837]